MRILFTSFPGLGHLHPLMPLALAAGAAGHDVRVASGPDMVDWTNRVGLASYPIGCTQAVAAAAADLDFAGPLRTAHMFTDVWVSRALADLLDLTANWPADLIVHEEEEYAGVLLAAILSVPCVTHSWAAPARPAYQRELATTMLSPIWNRYRLPAPARRVGELYLDACPPPFQTAELDGLRAETEIVTVQPGAYDGPPGKVPPPFRPLARPAAYVTLGSVAVFSDTAQLRAIALALAPHFASVILSTGPNSVDTLGVLPANVHVMTYVAQSAILPLVDVMVSHGGAGGSVRALLHGRPHLILPGFGQSQIAIAAATERLGTGLQLPPQRRSGDDLAQATHRLVDEATFADAARSVGNQLRQLPSPTHVLAMLERGSTRRQLSSPRRRALCWCRTG